MLRLQGERLADIVLTAPEQEDAAGHVRKSAEIPAIELRDVSFRYSDAEPDVLSGVNLRIEPGESVAIVGPSGCGKTTLLKLMLGIHAPQTGEMLVGGVPLSQHGPARLARHGRRGHAGRAAVLRLDLRQHQLLRPAARHGLGGALRARGLGARRDRGHADGLPHADRRHGLQPVGRAEAAHPAGARAVQAAEDPAAGRGHQRARRRRRARWSTRPCANWR